MMKTGTLKFSWKKLDNIDAYKVLILRNNVWVELVYIQNTDISEIIIPNIQYDVECPIKVQYIKKYKYTDSIIREMIYYCFLVGKEKSHQYLYRTPRQIVVKSTDRGNLISWEKIDGVSLYRIHRRKGREKWERIGLTNTNEFLDLDVTGNFYYTIRCIGDDGEKFVSSYDRKGACVAKEQ